MTDSNDVFLSRKILLGFFKNWFSSYRTQVKFCPKDFFCTNFIDENKLAGKEKNDVFKVIVANQNLLKKNEISNDEAFDLIFMPSVYCLKAEQELTEEQLTRISDDQEEFRLLKLKLFGD